MLLFPFISLGIYLLIWGAITLGLLPDPETLFTLSANLSETTLLILMGLIIFLESIIYVGFYLPGQFIAVILVIASADSWMDIIPLTIVSIIAVTLSAGVNYALGWYFSKKDPQKEAPIDWKRLLLSMIHINTLALALFDAGQRRSPKWIIGIVAILNLPYYLLIIGLTYSFQDAVIEIGENPYYLLIALLIWCGYSVYKNQKSR